MANFLEYIASHDDLIAAFGPNAAAGQAHFETDGRREGRTVTFDALAYIASHADLADLFGADRTMGAQHFITDGRREGRTVTFDAFLYLASNRDLLVAFGADTGLSAQHFITNGRFEGRRFDFDALSYLAANTDLIAAFGMNAAMAAQHFVTDGFREGRATSFDALSYLAANTDLIAAFGMNAALATQHYVTNGFAEGRATTFDAERYLAGNPDLIAAFGANTALATQHFVTDGFREGRTLAETAAIERTATNPAGETLFGLRDADRLVGGPGPDRLDGGGGDDDLTGGGGPDVFVLNAAAMRAGDLDVVRDFDPAEGDRVELGVFGPTSVEDAPGGVLARFAVAGGEARVLFAGLRADDLGAAVAQQGTEGDDVLVARAGVTAMLGLRGADVITGGAGAVRMLGGPGADRYVVTEVPADGLPDRVGDFGIGDRVALAGLLAGRDYDDVTDVLEVQRRDGSNMAIMLRDPASGPATPLIVLEAMPESAFARAAANPSRFLTEITDAARSQHGGAFGSPEGVQNNEDVIFSYVTAAALSPDGTTVYYAGGQVNINNVIATDVEADITAVVDDELRAMFDAIDAMEAALAAAYPNASASDIDLLLAGVRSQLESDIGFAIESATFTVQDNIFLDGDFIILDSIDTSDLRGLSARSLTRDGTERTLAAEDALAALPQRSTFTDVDLAVTLDEQFAIIGAQRASGGRPGVTLVDFRGGAPVETALTGMGSRGVFALEPGDPLAGRTPSLAYVRPESDVASAIVLRDLATGVETTPLADLADGAKLASEWLALSADGRAIGFSTDRRLTGDDMDDFFDLYGRDLDTGALFLISRGVEDRDVRAATFGATMDDELLVAEVGGEVLLFDLPAARMGVGGAVRLEDILPAPGDLEVSDGFGDSPEEIVGGVEQSTDGARAVAAGAGGRVIAYLTAPTVGDFFSGDVSALSVVDLRTGERQLIDAVVDDGNFGLDGFGNNSGFNNTIRLSQDGSVLAYTETFFVDSAETEVLVTDELFFGAPVDVSDIAAAALKTPAFVDGASRVDSVIDASDDSDWFLLPVGADAEGLVVRLTDPPGDAPPAGATLQIHRGRGPDSLIFKSAGPAVADARVAVFANTDFVDDRPDNSASEAPNLVASLGALGVTADRFTGTDAAALSAALAGRDAVVIPELENDAFIPDAAAAAVLRGFVEGGGALIVNGRGGNQDEAFLNAVFGFSLVDGGSFSGDETITRLAGAAGSAYADDAQPLLARSASASQQLASLPDGATPIYAIDDAVMVWEAPVGDGRVAFLAYDWFDAPPNSAAASGWLQALESALQGPPAAPHAIVDGAGAADQPLYARVAGATGDYRLEVIAEQRPGDDIDSDAFLFSGRPRTEALNPDEEHFYRLLPAAPDADRVTFTFTPTPDLLGDSLDSAIVTLHAADGAALINAVVRAGDDDPVTFVAPAAVETLFFSIEGFVDPSGGYTLELL